MDKPKSANGNAHAQLLEALYSAIRSHEERVVPMNAIQGEIVSVSPLRIRIDARLELDSNFIETYQKIPRGAVGCRVYLIKKRGGQTYILPYTQFWR